MNFDRFFDDPHILGIGKKENCFYDDSDSGKKTEITGLPEGRWFDDGVYLVESTYPLGEKYGSNILGSPDEMEVMRLFGATGRTVFIDLETTGLAGGTGTYAFMCGIGYVCGKGFKVIQLFLAGPAKERNWLAAIDSFIPEGSCLATYNGKTFDIPLLRTRHILARSAPVWDDMPHIDLLHHARRLYRGFLESCSLGSIERSILGVRRSGEDIPGYLIPGLYMDYLNSRDASPLKGVFYHNELDIVSLASFFCRVARILEGECRNGHEFLRAGDIWGGLGDSKKCADFWDKASKMSDSRVDALLRRAYHAKKNMDFTSAREDFSAVLSDLYAGKRCRCDWASIYTIHEELAKIEEHRFKRHECAIEHVDSALEWLKGNRYLIGRKFTQMQREMQHRRDRLERKLERRTAGGVNNEEN